MVSPETRLPELSYSHHREISSLPPEQDNVQDLITAVSGVLNVSLNHIIRFMMNWKKLRGILVVQYRNLSQLLIMYLRIDSKI